MLVAILLVRFHLLMKHLAQSSHGMLFLNFRLFFVFEDMMQPSCKDKENQVEISNHIIKLYKILKSCSSCSVKVLGDQQLIHAYSLICYVWLILTFWIVWKLSSQKYPKLKKKDCSFYLKYYLKLLYF